jgi:glutaredoxin-like protein
MDKPVRLVYFTQKFDCDYCQITNELLNELAGLSERISLEVYDFVGDIDKVKQYAIDETPAVVIVGEKDYGIRYYGAPAGYEFTSLIDDIIDVSMGTTSLSEKTKKVLAELKQALHIQVFVTPTCPYCPQAVRMAHQMALESDLVRGDMIEATEFPHLAHRYNVGAVPKVVINDEVEFEGAFPEHLYLGKVKEAEGRASALASPGGAARD